MLGIDPGMKGALAAVRLDDLELVAVADMPVAGGEIAIPLLSDFMRGLHADGLQVVSVAIERVHSMPRQGVASSFKFGRAFGTAEGFFGAIRPVVLVTPQTWKGTFTLNGKDKDEARLYAIKRWPGMAATFARIKDQDRGDAALIALHHAVTGAASGAFAAPAPVAEAVA